MLGVHNYHGVGVVLGGAGEATGRNCPGSI